MYPFINCLSDHDAQIVAFTDISISTSKQAFSLKRKVDSNTVNNFGYMLSYDNWENVFLEENVNTILITLSIFILGSFVQVFPL